MLERDDYANYTATGWKNITGSLFIEDAEV